MSLRVHMVDADHVDFSFLAFRATAPMGVWMDNWSGGAILTWLNDRFPTSTVARYSLLISEPDCLLIVDILRLRRASTP